LRPGADDDGDRRNGHVVDHILSSSSPCGIATPPSRLIKLQRVQAESLLPGVPRRALQVTQSSESEALFQFGSASDDGCYTMRSPTVRSLFPTFKVDGYHIHPRRTTVLTAMERARSAKGRHSSGHRRKSG
jgi:hypothetical protein